MTDWKSHYIGLRLEDKAYMYIYCPWSSINPSSAINMRETEDHSVYTVGADPQFGVWSGEGAGGT